MKKARFHQADVKRAVAGARAAGLNVCRVEVDQAGRIVVLAGDGQATTTANEWDEVLHETPTAS